MLVSLTNPLGFLHRCFLLFGLKNILIDHVSENTLLIFSFFRWKHAVHITLTAAGVNKTEPKTKGPYGWGQLVHANDT